MTPATPEEAIQRAEEAKSLMSYPAFAKAVAAARVHYTNLWMNSDPQNPGERETAYYCQSCLAMLENTLQQFVADGKSAERALEEGRKKHGYQ